MSTWRELGLKKHKWDTLFLSTLTPGEALREAEEEVMDYAYIEYDGNLTKMSKWLGCTIKSLYNHGFKAKSNVGRPKMKNNKGEKK